jgi:hypothetical protein
MFTSEQLRALGITSEEIQIQIEILEQQQRDIQAKIDDWRMKQQELHTVTVPIQGE